MRKRQKEFLLRAAKYNLDIAKFRICIFNCLTEHFNLYNPKWKIFFSFSYMKQNLKETLSRYNHGHALHAYIISHNIRLEKRETGKQSEHIFRSIDVHTFLSLSLAFGLSCSDFFFSHCLNFIAN